MRPVAVLCAMMPSVYDLLPACVVYNRARDARNFAGDSPVVAHPPCAQWGRWRAMPNVRASSPRGAQEEMAA